MNLYARRIHDLDRARRDYAETWMSEKAKEMGYAYICEAIQQGSHEALSELWEAYRLSNYNDIAVRFERAVESYWYPIAYQAACEECE